MHLLKGFFHFQDHFKLNCHFHFLIHWVLLKSPQWEMGKKCKNSYFSDFECIVLLLGGVLHKIFIKQISLDLLRGIFRHQLWPVQTPPSCFCRFYHFYLFLSSKKIIINKNRLDSLVQNFTKFRWKLVDTQFVHLTTLLPIFQQMHSGVQCWSIYLYFVFGKLNLRL